MDFHGEAVVVHTHAGAAVNGIVHRIPDGIVVVQVLEVVQEEKALLETFLVFLTQPEAVVRKREFQIAAGRIGVSLSAFFGNDFGNKPVVQMFGVLAVARKFRSTHGNAIRPQFTFDHSLGQLIAAACTKVLAGRARLVRDIFFIFTVAVQPVKHHHWQVFQGAVAQFAREFRIKFGNAVQRSRNPHRIAEGKDGIQQDFLVDRDFFVGVAFCTHVMAAYRLLEIDVDIFHLDKHARLEPAAIRRNERGHVVFVAVQVHHGAGVVPRGQETDGLFLGKIDFNVGLGIFNVQGAVVINDNPRFVNRLFFLGIIVFGENFGKQRRVVFVQIGSTAAGGAAKAETEPTDKILAVGEAFLGKTDGKHAIFALGK